MSVEQDGADRETRVAHGELAIRQRGQLDACAVRVAVLALQPVHLPEFFRGHAVIDGGHQYPLPTAPRISGLSGIAPCSLLLAGGERVPRCVSTVCCPPCALSKDLCTERMNVHLVLHLLNISGNMALSTQLTP